MNMKKLLSILSLGLLVSSNLFAGNSADNVRNEVTAPCYGVESVNAVAHVQDGECPLNVCNFTPYTKAQIIAKLGNKNIDKQNGMWTCLTHGYLNIGDDGQFSYQGFFMTFNKNGRLKEVTFIMAEDSKSAVQSSMQEFIYRMSLDSRFSLRSGALYQKNGRGKVNLVDGDEREGKYTWGIIFKYLK
jgi:hypothetical protein